MSSKTALVHPKTGKPLRMLSISDIHLVHNNTPTKHITDNIEKEVMTEENKDLDIIFIAGDLFEKEFSAGTDDINIFLLFMGRLLKYCKDNEIKLRVLEGTPRHDAKQPSMVPNINKLREIEADVEYFQFLDVEYIADLNLHVLYIPDEWCNDHDLLEEQISEKLHEKGITQVDVGVFHGVFNYQVVGTPYSSFKFEESYFSQVVRSYIFIGHWHFFTEFKTPSGLQIISMGSFDRLRHGEEDDKGFVTTIGDEWTFHKNPNAFIYKTIRVTKKDTLLDLDRRLESYPEGSFIRLAMAKDHPLNTDFSGIQLRYPEYVITKKMDGDTEKGLAHLLDDTSFNLTTFDFLNKNLKDLVIDRLKEKNNLDEKQLKKLDVFLDIFQGSENKELALE